MADNLSQIAGTVGRNPEIKDSSKGEFTVFSVATNLQYGDGDDTTRWISVAVNKPALQDFVQAKIRKGSQVVVEGYLNENHKNGVTYFNLNGFRVGLVDWFIAGGSRRRDEEEEDL